jgi:hypothetical protein
LVPLFPAMNRSAALPACDTEIYGAARFFAPSAKRSQVSGDSFDHRHGDGD